MPRITPPLTLEQRNYIRRAYAEGVTYKDMAKELKVTRETISGHIYRMGLTNRRSSLDRNGRPKRQPEAEPEKEHTKKITLAPIPPPRS